MAGETRFINELNKLRSMPFFYVRFISLGMLFALNDISRVFTDSPSFAAMVALLVASGVTFLTFEIICVLRHGGEIAFSKLPVILWGLLCVCCLISSLINGFSSNFLVMLLIYPALIVMCREEGFVNLVLASCGIAVTVDLAASAIFYPLISNSLSVAFAGMMPVLLCAIAWVLLNTKRFYSSLFTVSVLLCAALIYFSGISGGRTGFLTIIATLFFFIIAVTVKFVSAKKNIVYSNRVINSFIITAVIMLIVLTVSAAIVIDSAGEVPPDGPASIENTDAFTKFILSIQNGNFFSNRGMIWKYTFEHARLFGNGPNFYIAPDILTPDQSSAHNSYLAILGHYGLFAFVLFLVFCVTMLILSVRYCLASRRLYIFPFTVLVTYYTAGITEDLIYMYYPRGITILFFVACAYLTVIDAKQGASQVTKAKR